MRVQQRVHEYNNQLGYYTIKEHVLHSETRPAHSSPSKEIFFSSFFLDRKKLSMINFGNLQPMLECASAYGCIQEFQENEKLKWDLIPQYHGYEKAN